MSPPLLMLAVLKVIASQATDLEHRAHTALDIVGALERCGFKRFGATLLTGGVR